MIVILIPVAALVVGGAVAYSVMQASAPVPPVPSDLAGADRAFAHVAQGAIDAVRAQPRDPGRWLELGMMYEANQMMTPAETCYETSARLGGGARATYHLAVLRSRLGDIAGAADAMQRTIDADPSHGPAHWRIGFWLLDQHRLDEAEHAFREAMARRSGPFDLAGELGLARVHLARGQLDRARALLEAVSQRPSPYAPYASHLLGTTLVRQGEVEAGKAALARGRAAEPVFADPLHEQINRFRTDVEWQVSQSKALVARGDYAQAIAMLEQAANERPDDLFVLNNLAIAYIGARRFEHATTLLEDVLRASPGSYQGHFNLALAAHARASMIEDADESRDLIAQAVEHLDASLELNPAFGGALGMKADLLREAGRHEEALELYFRGLATEPTSVMWWRGAAHSAAACGRLEDARRCIQQLDALRPGDPQTRQLADEIEVSAGARQRDAAVPVPGRSHAGDR